VGKKSERAVPEMGLKFILGATYSSSEMYKQGHVPTHLTLFAVSLYDIRF
jgi:hypothetical protein